MGVLGFNGVRIKKRAQSSQSNATSHRHFSSKKRRLASLTQTLEDERSWQQGKGEGQQEKMMGLVKEAARLENQVS